jgi:peptidyl-tRNA hydrolase, PTH1 family
MILIVGLGNPGERYQRTRHNIGFTLCQALANKYNATFKLNKKFNAEIAEINDAELSDEKIVFALPHTFMNNSGDAVQKLSLYFKVPTEQIWVIFDELDLPLGSIKLQPSGGAGSHNGVKSIVQVMGEKFPRLRIGIESRGDSAPVFQDTSSFVLSEFFSKEQEIVIDVLDRCIQSIELALKQGIETAMNKFN